MTGEERWAWDCRQVTIAARLLGTCLGIPVQPAFDVSDREGPNGVKANRKPLGQGLFKDAYDVTGGSDERPNLVVLVVDENGEKKAESKQCYALGFALDLLARLPLPVSPKAEQWFKNCMGEGGPATGRPILRNPARLTARVKG
jgi:hypothetical protein